MTSPTRTSPSRSQSLGQTLRLRPLGDGDEAAFLSALQVVGHGIGMVIHEEPQLLLDVHDPVVEGMTLEIELGYFGETGGYHIEDMVHVTASGAINLTQRDPSRRLIESGR